MTSFLPALIVIFASALTGSLVYYKIPVSNLFQIAAVSLFIALIYSIKFVLKKGKIGEIGNISKLILTALSVFLTQVIVVATGGFYSPLLIIIHIYTLGSGFLISITTSITFLIATIFVLGGQLYWDTALKVKLKEDPGVAAIYLASFIVIIPLAQFIMKTYNLKDKMSRLLGEYLHLGKQREDSILSGLTELVFVTNKDLKIVSINEAAQKELKLSVEHINKPLFEVLPIQDKNNEPVKIENLPIKNILEDKAIRIVKDLFLTTPSKGKTQIFIQIKPIDDSKGEVSQLIFIISDSRLYSDEKTHSDLDQALSAYHNDLQSLKQAITLVNTTGAVKMVDIISHVEEDIRLALEVEDHAIKEEVSFEDVVFVARQATQDKESFAKSMGVGMLLTIVDNEAAEKSWLSLKEGNINSHTLGKSEYTVPIDPVWLKLLIQKLLDISILLSSGVSPKIDISISHKDDLLILEIANYNQQIEEQETKILFTKYYEGLEKGGNLRWGSGLEGFLAKYIADELKLNLNASVLRGPDRLVFTLEILTNPKT